MPLLDEHPFFAPQTRWVLANCGIIDPTNIDEYIARGGYRALADALTRMTPEQVCDVVEASGLRGRGGGGFPTGKKWKFARASEADQKYLICNADEGDPGAFMDRAVIEGDPHRLVEGMAIAAYASAPARPTSTSGPNIRWPSSGCSQAIAQAETGRPAGREHPRQRLRSGDRHQDGGRGVRLRRRDGADPQHRRPTRHAASASAVSGRQRTVRQADDHQQRRDAGQPAHRARAGPGGFSAVGTETSKGTKVFALSGKVACTGLVEVAMGTTVREVVFDIGGGIPDGKAYKAVQIGGPSGGCIPEQHLDIEIDYESLKTVGAMMGSGGLVVMDEDTCMVDVAKFFMDFIQRESCGKCIPCREGTRRMLEILNAHHARPGSERAARRPRTFQERDCTCSSWPRRSATRACAAWGRRPPTRC